MTNKNAEYQKNIREKRKSEGKKSLQIPASTETAVKLDDFKRSNGLKSNEKALERLLFNNDKYLELLCQKKKPPTFKEWLHSLFSRQAGE